MPKRGESRRPSRADLEQAIRETDWNMTRLAERLGVTRQTVYAWIRQLDLAAAVAIRRREQEEAMWQVKAD
jgi:transcriptional regulator of acetoin/glycerol metabolism